MHAKFGSDETRCTEVLDGAGVAHELKSCSSAEALASLGSGGCEIAGLRVPLGKFEPQAVEYYRRWVQLGNARATCSI